MYIVQLINYTKITIKGPEKWQLKNIQNRNGALKPI